MTKIKDYLTNPATRISFLVFVFWLGGLYATTNARISAVENDVREIQWYKLDVKIAEIQKDIQYMRENLDRVLKEIN
jgi:hypothetical protein